MFILGCMMNYPADYLITCILGFGVLDIGWALAHMGLAWTIAKVIT